MAAKLVIEPIFEADFCPNSYGYRPKKSTHHAVDEIAESLHQESKSWKTGNSYQHICPAPKSLAKIKDRITQLTARERTTIPLGDIVGSMNATLRGWANYFHYRNSSVALGKVKTHAEERLRTHLMKRHNVKDRGIGIGRFPSYQLYTKYGLYKVPTTAGWKTAYA